MQFRGCNSFTNGDDVNKNQLTATIPRFLHQLLTCAVGCGFKLSNLKKVLNFCSSGHYTDIRLMGLSVARSSSIGFWTQNEAKVSENVCEIRDSPSVGVSG